MQLSGAGTNNFLNTVQMIELFKNEHFLTTVVSVVIAFLFGQTGIFKTWFEYIFNSQKKRAEKEDAEAAKIEAENAALKQQIEELRKIASDMNIDLVKATAYIKTLLYVLEMAMPQGTNAAIDQMVKDIKNAHETPQKK